jgi:transposase-like protein
MNLIEIRNNFPTELSCIEYAESVRWEKGVECPYCESENYGERNKDNRYHCKDCQKSFSVTVKTALHDTRLPLSTWFSAISVITDAKKGMSAKQLQRNIGVSYPTAFKMYHSIRDLMEWENPKADELSGIVEMDETFIGGKPRKMNEDNLPQKKRQDLDERIKELKEKGWKFKRKRGNPAKPDLNPKRGRGTDNIKVAGIVERNGNVVAEVMKNLSHQELKKMVEKYVDQDNSVLITDEYGGYNKMHKVIEHIRIDHESTYSYRGVNTNSIESFWAIIKRGIIGQYHSVSAKYLPNYIAEFVFKYNNRETNEIMFDILLQNALKPIEGL